MQYDLTHWPLGWCCSDFNFVIFKHILVIDMFYISCETALRLMPQDLADYKSTLVQVMAWCHQAPSHYLNQCWSSSMTPYGTPGPSFIKPDQLDPWIKDQLINALLSTILSLQLPNFVSCGRACPSHRTQNLVTVGTKLLTGEWFSFDPWSMDQADLVW